MNEINIREEQIVYKLDTDYCSDLKGQNYTAKITGIKEPNGKVTLMPEDDGIFSNEFVFKKSDPDRVIAIARLMMGMAQMIKNNNNSRQLGGEE